MKVCRKIKCSNDEDATCDVCNTKIVCADCLDSKNEWQNQNITAYFDPGNCESCKTLCDEI